MAAVYRALDTRLDRQVALKIMQPSFAEDPEFVQRFIREAQASARLSDPHIVRSSTKATTTAWSSWRWSTSRDAPCVTC